MASTSVGLGAEVELRKVNRRPELTGIGLADFLKVRECCLLRVGHIQVVHG